LQAIDHPGISGLAVSSGSAGFLIIGLNALGQIQMGNEAHIRLIDTHAECDGRDDH
jgi:hypothetical protein